MPAKHCGIDAFLEMMAAERGAAANTLEAYRRDLDDYEGALTDAGKTLRNAATDDIRAYLSALKTPRLCGDDDARAGSPPFASSIVFLPRKAIARTIPPPFSKGRVRRSVCRKFSQSMKSQSSLRRRGG